MSRACVLFDLDGTLVDTAPDMLGALQVLCQEYNQEIQNVDALRPLVSQGSKALLEAVFSDVDPEELLFRKRKFLDYYSLRISQESRLFSGMEAVLKHLEAQKIPWGVVTNKPLAFSLPLLKNLELYERLSVLVAGDSLPQQKPHPEPVRHACRRIGCAPEQGIFIGDALRDVQAAKAAGMPVLLALFGYVPAEEDLESWGADALIAQPEMILAWL
jgi:phosphoglycolate phosphatase